MTPQNAKLWAESSRDTNAIRTFRMISRPEYSDSYSRADLMVTDVSGTGFTFSFGFGKPTVFFVSDAEAERGLSGLQFEARHRIGCVVRTIDELEREATQLSERDMRAEIEQFRNEAIFNVGNAAANIAERLDEILSKSRADRCLAALTLACAHLFSASTSAESPRFYRR